MDMFTHFETGNALSVFKIVLLSISGIVDSTCKLLS